MMMRASYRVAVVIALVCIANVAAAEALERLGRCDKRSRGEPKAHLKNENPAPVLGRARGSLTFDGLPRL